MLNMVLRGNIPDSKMVKYRKKYFNRPKTHVVIPPKTHVVIPPKTRRVGLHKTH